MINDWLQYYGILTSKILFHLSDILAASDTEKNNFQITIVYKQMAKSNCPSSLYQFYLVYQDEVIGIGI